MATSLAAQLKRLATPQTKLLTQDKKKASFLFDPKDAATKDRETIFEIGLSGLEELKLRNPKFELFESTLFSPSSKQFERSVQSKETNQKLNKNIKRFLLLLSPHFLQPAAHKCLEWLINRFHIHDFNKNELFMLILPYHETRYFARCLQMLDISENSDKWNWLISVQKAGAPLSKTALLNRCANDNVMLKFVCNMVVDAVKELENRANTLTTMFAFYCTSLVGALEYSTDISETQATTVLPSLLKALSSEVKDFAASGFLAIAQLVTKTKLSQKLLEQVVIKVSQIQHVVLRTEAILLLILIYRSQKDVFSEVPLQMLSKLANSKWFPIALGQVIASGNNIMPLLLPLFKEALLQAQGDEESLRDCSKTLINNLVAEIKLPNENIECLIRCVIDNFKGDSLPEEIINLDSDSELEIEEPVQTPQHMETRSWYCECLKSIERKYPESFDEVVKNIMRSQSSKNTKTSLKNILGLLPSTSHGVGTGSSMFENLYSHHPKIRLAAVNYIVAKSHEIDISKNELLKNSILERLKDENPHVFKAVLGLKLNILLSIVSWPELQNILITTLNKSYKDPDRWLIAVPNALKLLCSSYSETDELKILCSIFPFLFPKHDNELHKVHTIIRSNFGSNCKFIKKLAERIDKSNNSKSICTHVFTFLEENDELNALHLIDILKESTDKSDVNKFISLLLLTSSLKKDIHVENSCLILEYALELLLDTDIKALKKTTHLNKDNLQLYISKCYKGVLPVDIFIYFLNGLIRSTNINQIQSLNLSNYNASSKFLISLFEILITGCSVTDNDIVIQYAHVINNFFAKYGSSIDKKCEFISYFFNSLNLESNTSNKNIIINSELQVRCLRVAKALLKKTNDCLDVILNSSIFLQNVLITLTNPIICIRKICMDIIQVLLKKCEDNNKEHYYLLSQLIIHKEEILLDHEQLPLVLFLILSPESDTKKSERSQKSEGLKLIYRYITDKNNPLHLSSAMLKIFSLVNSEEILNDASNLALDVLEYGKNNDKPLDNNRSLIIQNIIHRINKQTVKVINQNSAIWTFILKCLQYHNIHVTLGKEISNICKLLLDQIDNDIFLNIPKSLHASLISCVIDTATDSEMPTIISSASKFMKRIELDGNLIQNELQIMRDVKNPDVEGKDTTKRRSRRINVAPSPALLLTRQWKRGVTLLEFVQNKKKINDVENMLPMVFDVLKRCLEFDIQAPVEYTKQLLLSCILHCCNKLSVDQHKLKELPENIFNIELVVQCIRATSNPQTHHHALMLLCQMAEIVPEQVLHNMMAIFTFMGSSVLRHDDAYSFQIITKLIESVIPKLIEHSLDEMNEERATKLEKYIVPLLRVFVAVLLDVPEHRRIPLYKKLIDTLSPEHFLWLFLGLVFEAQVLHGENNKDKASQRRLDIASTLTREYPPNVIIHSCNKLLIYVKTLPIEKENIGSASINNALIFNYNYHTPKQLRHFKYTLITFVSGLISSPLFMNTIAVLKEAEMSKLETLYKTMIVNTLTLIQLLSKINDKNMGTPQSKYWKVMLHHAYDILDSVNGLLSADMFLLVIKGLMSHNLHTVRRKAMELLINRLQHNITFFDNCNKETLFGVLEPLTKVVETINNKEFMENGNTLEIEMNQQTALLAIKLLSKLLGPIQPIKFKPILILVTGFTAESNNIQQNVLSSVVLCLAELCNNLGSSAIENIPNIMPALINILKTKTKEEGTVELLLLSTITALQKIIECLALFLSPYLEKILYELAVLEYKFHQENQQNSQFQYKLKTISSKISSAIAPRVLIPAVKESYLKLIKKRNYNAIAFVMNTLSESFANISNADFTAHQKDLTNFFLDALQFRCEITEDDISESDIQNVEEHIFKAFVTLVLKLSESSFKPLYYRLFDWAATSSLNKNRSITFYRLSNRIAESLKGLFVLFAGCFINNACVLLDSCNVIKTDVLYFEEPEKCIILVESIMKTFYSVFLYDSQNFINKEKFEIIMQPLVDQLENNLGDLKELRNRAKCVIIPCISQLAVASADDSLWKQLNYQVLLKTRHASSEIRLCGLDTTCEIARKVGEDFLPLLPETIPFLAELLEDEDPEIESSCQKAIQQIEVSIGETLQKYF